MQHDKNTKYKIYLELPCLKIYICEKRNKEHSFSKEHSFRENMGHIQCKYTRTSISYLFHSIE